MNKFRLIFLTKLDLQYEQVGAVCGDIRRIQNKTYMYTYITAAQISLFINIY